MIFKMFPAVLAAAVTLVFSSCAMEKERKPVPAPGSDVSDKPWNVLQPGEGLGQFGAFQQR